MANELRVRQNFLGGLVEDNPLTPTATTLTSGSLAAMAAIGTTQHMPIILDPDGIFGAPEIAYITAHTNTATTATILRGQEGTTARQHNRDVPWLHGATVLDFAGASRFKIANGRSSPNYTTSSTTLVDIDATNLTVTIAARVGDVLEMELLSATFFAGSSNTDIFIDYDLNGVKANGGGGIYGTLYWGGLNNAYRTPLPNLKALVTVTSAMIVSGSVPVKVQWAVGAAGPIYLGADTTSVGRPRLLVRNLGPQEG